MYVASQSTVCEWHQFQGLNEVIYSPYRQNFRACGGLRGNLITPSRTRPPVGARLLVPTHCPCHEPMWAQPFTKTPGGYCAVGAGERPDGRSRQPVYCTHQDQLVPIRYLMTVPTPYCTLPVFVFLAGTYLSGWLSAYDGTPLSFTGGGARAALHERASAMPGRAERHGDGRLDRGSKQQCGCGALPLRGC